MGLFGKKSKKDETATCGSGINCGSGKGSREVVKQISKEYGSIKILGSGCAKCNQLESAVKDALIQLGMRTEVEHVTDFTQIAAYGVMATPALVVDEKVVSYGKVLKTKEVVKILEGIKE